MSIRAASLIRPEWVVGRTRLSRGLSGRLALLIALVAIAWFPARLAAATALSAEERVQQVSDSVLVLIEAARGYANDDPERFYREFTAILDPAVDFDAFARSVMAVHFRAATPEQRRRFADSFKWGLVRTYALALTEFSNGTVRVVPSAKPAQNKRLQSVRMEVTTPSGNVYPVQYAMALGSDGEWRVRNIIVNGVNMGLTYRNQFAGAMKDPANGGSLDKVIDGWSNMLKKEAEELEDTLSSDSGEGDAKGGGGEAGGQ
ncbi:MAG: MlaC/ttg2D family ABC transporter substrate-binding protein [Pseudomonadales bacterium]|jgi:phospholipid transport system substrate-binding protein